eukprot:TRINITY_DN3679_c0_g2_i2.p1 TRINITY_DN3679_c0_g2~~TRINITY_DN3679_c0_g2_i2.p1  ORF type:complete len:910 (+),score=157.18 TRINITY_DN3679_c0_g2_i2:178-2907(+)
MMMGVLVRALFVLMGLFLRGSLCACPSATYRDSYTSTPAYPATPSASITTSDQRVPSAYDPVVQDHWSEVANLKKYRPLTTYSFYNRSTCPHVVTTALKDWHNPTTWTSGVVPANGAAVILPANTAVLVSSCSVEPSTIFGIVTVPKGSSLIFGDADIAFSAKGFNVQGSLLAGSATCRIAKKVVITLVGKRTDQTLPTLGQVKGINVTGTLDLHGAKYSPTWSRLAMTARINDKYIYIQDKVNWQAGQRIVITTTELKDSRDWHRNEERTIVAVLKTTLGTSVTAIQVDTPLLYKHFGGKEFQAEVALLSRNVIVQGDASSAPTDMYPIVCNNTFKPTERSTFPCEKTWLTGFGAHVIIDGSQGTKPTARLSGVELFRVGQTNVIGRYPIHYHMLGDVTPSNYKNHYVQDSSVHDSYFRCYAIHGTSGVRLIENTAYNAIGHCYFLEDGVEENNTLSFNQAAHIHPLGPFLNPSLAQNGDAWNSGQYLAYYTNTPDLILPSDMSAAAFYVTNTYNDFVGNAASGGWAGFAMPSLAYPVKLHYGKNTMCPKNRPFRSAFRGNSAHSSGFWWSRAGAVYVGGELRQDDATGTLSYTAGRSATHDTCGDKLIGLPGQSTSCTQPVWLRFEDNKVFLANRGLQHWGSRSEIIRFEFHDVGLSMNVFGKVWIDSMLMECRNKNHNVTWFSGCPSAPTEGVAPSSSLCNPRDYEYFSTFGGFQWYDVGQQHILTNSTFRNCEETWSRCVYPKEKGICNNVAVFTSLTHSDQFVPEMMQVTYNLKFQNVTDVWRYSTSGSSYHNYTVSSRLQNWLDADGSASRLAGGGRTVIGSARAKEWWKINSGCILENEAYKCKLSSSFDSLTSIVIKHNPALEAEIGESICLNPAPADGSKPCVTVAKVNIQIHFVFCVSM